MAKRKRHKKVSALQEMMHEMQGNDNTQKVVVNPQSEAKMSAAITELIAPYREMAGNRTAYYNLVATACIAWNTANLPQDEWLVNISEAMNALPNMTDDTRPEMIRFILELIRRKIMLFPENRRIIVNFKLTESKDSYHLGIASTNL